MDLSTVPFQKTSSPKGQQKLSPLIRRTLFLGIVLLLSCTTDPDTEQQQDPSTAELIRVEGVGEKELQKRFKGKGAKVHILDSKQDGVLLLLIEKGDRDSLPTPLRKLQGKASLERIEPSSAELPEQSSVPTDLTGTESPSGMDLPDIFDIFTRIY